MSTAFISGIDVLEISVIKKKFVHIPWRLPKTIKPFRIICQHMNQKTRRDNFFYLIFGRKLCGQAFNILDNRISLTNCRRYQKHCLSEISGKFIKYEDISARSHIPELLASDCFLSEKRDSKVGCEFSNSIFAI